MQETGIFREWKPELGGKPARVGRAGERGWLSLPRVQSLLFGDS